MLVSGNVIILPAALDRAASSAPLGSAAKTRMAGLMDLAANATPDIKPPPTFFFFFFCLTRSQNKSAQKEIYNKDEAGA